MIQTNWTTERAQQLQGELHVPGDKSISHRAIMLGALAEGQTEVSGFLEGEDCLSTMRAFQAMGVPICRHGQGRISIEGRGLYGLRAPISTLDVGNSGTSMRLMAGVLAGQQFDSTLIGDHSLMRRPMRRVTEPLALMGAKIQTSEQGTAPLFIHGAPLKAIDYTLPVASAQLKSCLLLAGLYAQGQTILRSCGRSRDHSERMLRAYGIQIEGDGNVLTIMGGQQLRAVEIDVPGDISSAAFFMVAGLIAPSSHLVLRRVGINPTRAAVIDILQQMGGDIRVQALPSVGGEPVADIHVRSSQLKGIRINPAYVPIAIDEFPVIFVAAACAQGTTHATDLAELRVKESDRLSVMAQGLTDNGVTCQMGEDSLSIMGGAVRGGGHIDSEGDHRIAMSFAVLGAVAERGIRISNCATVATSFPNFTELAANIGMQIEVTDA